MGCDNALVQNVVCSAFSIHGALTFGSTVAGGIRASPFKDLGVVGCYYLLEIGGGSIGHLDSISVNDFVEGAVFWKVGV